MKCHQDECVKLAVTAKGTTLESAVDPRFGRAAYFLIVDTETIEFEVVDNKKIKEKLKMDNGRIAVPSNGIGGLEGTRAGHFGHCDCFTFIDVENGEIKDVSTLQNQEHSQGGCMVPVNLLASNNVNFLIVGGIGMRPLMGFKQVGIKVYHEDQQSVIKPVVDAMIADALMEIRDDQVCGGGNR